MYCTVQYSTVQYSTVQYYTVTVLYCTQQNSVSSDPYSYTADQNLIIDI